MSDDFASEYKSEIRKQIRQQAVKWFLAGAVGLILVAIAGWWIIIKGTIDSYIFKVGKGIPDPVVVVSTTACNKLGSDWGVYSPATARFIVGAGAEFHDEFRKWTYQDSDGVTKSKNLTSRRFLTTGGEVEHFLREEEIPSHEHPSGGLSTSSDVQFIHRTDKRALLTKNKSDLGLPASAYPLFGFDPGNPLNFGSHGHDIVGITGAYGGSAAHNNMPPYIALYFCIRDTSDG